MPNVEFIRCCMLLHFVATIGVDGTARILPFVQYVTLSTKA